MSRWSPKSLVALAIVPIAVLAAACGEATTSSSSAGGGGAAPTKDAAAAGKPGVSVQVFQDQNSTNLALSSGRLDVVILDSQVARYQAKLNNQFKVSGKEYGVTPYGIACPKGNGTADAVLAALKDLISNGVYKKILKTWNLESNGITNPVINGAVS